MQPAAQSTPPAIEVAHKSDPGRDPEKQVNEDVCTYRATRFGHLCVVCDGMGGHASGREASTLALETILKTFDAAPQTTHPAQVLHDAIAEANRAVYAMGADHSRYPAAHPGSTCVAVLMHASGTEVAHVGDSRCYLVHHAQIFQITKDHSMVQQLVDAGLLTPAQAAVHPNANQITRALGMGPEIEVDVRPQAVAHVVGDCFVLCSDGLSDLVEPPEVLQIVGSQPPAQAVGQLVDLANARGGHDNITVIVLRARESAKAQPQQIAPTLMTPASVKPTIAEDEPTSPGGEPRTKRERTTLPDGMPPPGVIPPAVGSDPRASGSTIPIMPASIPHAPPPPAASTRGPLGGRTTTLAGLIVAAAVVALALIVTLVVMHGRAARKQVPPPTPTATASATSTSP